MYRRYEIHGRVGLALLTLFAILLTAGAINAGDNVNRPHNGVVNTNEHETPIEVPPHSSDQLVVKFATMNGQTISNFLSQYGTVVNTHLPRLGIYLIEITDGTTPIDMVAQMEDDPRIISVQPNFLLDPMRPVQGSFAFPDESLEGDYLGQPAAIMMNVTQAHLQSMGNNVRIAVIDGGVNYEHPAFDEKVISAYDYIDGDYDANDEPGGDNSGHGTFVAGVIHLIAPQADIYAYRVCDPSGEGNGYLVAEAIMQAVDNNCSVINLSLVTSSNHDAIATAIEYAKTKDILVVAAAGNGNSADPLYPACDPYVITVGAVDNESQIASFSNAAEYVDVYAPGVDIYSPYLENGYAWWSGTSFATPFVTGQAALLLQNEGDATLFSSREWIINVIEQTVSGLKITGETSSSGTGGGVIDLLASLAIEVPEFGVLANYHYHPDIIYASTTTTSRYYLYYLCTSGTDPLDFTIESIDTPEFVKSWIVDGPTTPTFVQFEIDPTGLPLGVYQDTVLITIDGIDNSPITKIFTINVTDEDSPIEAYGVNNWTSRLVEGSPDVFQYNFKPMARQWDPDGGYYRHIELPYQVDVEPDPEFICGIELWTDYYSEGNVYQNGLTTDYWLFSTTAGDLTPGIYYDTIYISVDGAVNNPYILEIMQIVRPDEWINMTVLEPYPSNLTQEEYNPIIRHQSITFHDVPIDYTGIDTLTVEIQVDGAPRAYEIEHAYYAGDPIPGFIEFTPMFGTTTDTIEVVVDWSHHNYPHLHDSVYYNQPWDVIVENVANYNYIFDIRFNFVDTIPDAIVEDKPVVNGITNYPNPFNPITDIKFSLTQEADVKLGVFNVLGQTVKVLIDESLPTGDHTVTWDGTDASGRQVASGIYFYKIVAGDFIQSRKMVLLK